MPDGYFNKKAMAHPIWKDYFVTLGTGTAFDYRIVLTDTSALVYSGRAVARPGETDVVIRINDVCADYLVNVLPTISDQDFSYLHLPLSFTVQAYIANTWTDVESVAFLNDWSYDYSYDAATMGLSFPITGRIDARMPIIWTGINVPDVTMTIHYLDETTETVVVPVATYPDFNNDFNHDFARSVRTAGSGSAVFFVDQYDLDLIDYFEVGRSTFRVVTSCARYALYYVNAYGGWDCLLIEGASIESDDLTRYKMESEYDNRDIANRGVRNYANEISRGFTLHTGWLLGDQGMMMHNLINSTDVFLYDIASNEMIPVTISNPSCEYKTNKTEGRLVDYAVNVQIAHYMVRR